MPILSQWRRGNHLSKWKTILRAAYLAAGYRNVPVRTLFWRILQDKKACLNIHTGVENITNHRCSLPSFIINWGFTDLIPLVFWKWQLMANLFMNMSFILRSLCNQNTQNNQLLRTISAAITNRAYLSTMKITVYTIKEDSQLPLCTNAPSAQAKKPKLYTCHNNHLRWVARDNTKI